MIAELSAKRLQLLTEAVPSIVRVAVLWNPDTPYARKVVEELRAAGPSLSIELSFVSWRLPEELESAFCAVGRAHSQALYILGDAMFIAHRTALIRMSAKARLPTVYGYSVYVSDGGLM